MSPKMLDVPSLRLERGDVIIRLSERPEDTLLLHSSLLKQFIYFEPTLNGRWGRPFVELPVPQPQQSGNEPSITVWQYVLALTEDTSALLLRCANDQTSFQFTEYFFGLPFHMSEYTAGLSRREDLISWPDKSTQQAVNAHKALFRLLYGLYVNLDFTPDPESAIRCMADVTAYAEFYGMLDIVRPAITETLLDIQGLWEDVAWKPLFYLGLAAKLRCECIYDDALKHVVFSGHWGPSPMGGYGLGDWDVGNPLDYDVFDHKKLILSLLGEREEIMSTIQHAINQLRSIGYQIMDRGPDYVYTDDIKVVESLKKQDGKCKWIARSIYNEWEFKTTCKLLVAHGSKSPPDISIFGDDEYLRLLGQHDCPNNHHQEPFQCLQKDLTEKLKPAADIAKEALQANKEEGTRHETKFFMGMRPPYRRTKYHPWKNLYMEHEDFQDTIANEYNDSQDSDEEEVEDQEPSDTEIETARFHEFLNTITVESASLEWASFVSVPAVGGESLIISTDNSIGLASFKIGLDDGEPVPWKKSTSDTYDADDTPQATTDTQNVDEFDGREGGT
ncbi:uncharacterized protein K452DRAFT_307237 [Aplosporella prunicola CBS 121167]|uniref:Uncharacterized protein n=1 Tax=Aplosporella prunicola CBS 121167 TaxID=1176127 RepID=A0A6A6BKT7_9PEZI|nr:uncharacterized protein K452DRAFT_307237 [Aplosporella prunicola CBS 121167]KAF2143884.1 hypothetical protein K452DRAFT_307237 [Aplosporella prunicola CBS 121167]